MRYIEQMRVLPTRFMFLSLLPTVHLLGDSMWRIASTADTTVPVLRLESNSAFDYLGCGLEVALAATLARDIGIDSHNIHPQLR